MKVSADHKVPFNSVRLEIILESQDEVNQLYTLGNFSTRVTQFLMDNSLTSTAGGVSPLVLEKLLSNIFRELSEHKISKR